MRIATLILFAAVVGVYLDPHRPARLQAGA